MQKRAPRTKAVFALLACGLTLLGILWSALYYALGVWLPDIASGKETLLASAESVTGERFKVVQFWSYDFYTTQVEQVSPDGTINVAVIDCDDRKQWPSSSWVSEAEKKFVINLSDGSPPVEYLWEKKWFVTLPGWVRVRE